MKTAALTKNGKILFLGFFLAIIPLLLIGKRLGTVSNDSNKAIVQGIEYLNQNQNPAGDFDELECTDREMTDCKDSSSIFSTLSILYSIGNIRNEKVYSINQKGVNLLQREKYAGNLWSYYGKNSRQFISPDLDDSALASFILEKNGHEVKGNAGFFEGNRSKDYLFKTWLSPFLEIKNDVDCAVNANVLMYLNKNDENVCNFINASMAENKKCSYYYPEDLAVYYVISRSAKEGVTCLNDSKNKIIENILLMQKKDGSFGNDVQNALAVNALLNFDYKKGGLQKGIEAIIKKQSNEGCWEEGMVWSTKIDSDSTLFFGSKELTTALSMEALDKYLN